MHKKVLTLVLLTVVALAFNSCKTVPNVEDIPLDATPIELAQKGQSALDANNYKAAEVYYQTLIDRYQGDPATTIAAEFEIAHLRMKKKQWHDAQERLEAIINAYNTTGGTNLPPEFLILAQNDLARIPEDKLK